MNTIPEQVNIIDIFHKRIFDCVDFDFIIEYLQANHYAKCTGIYTVDSLAKGLVPELTYQALESRSAGDLLKLYPAVIKLCVRRRRKLLVHVDFVTGKLKHIRRIEDFVDYAGLNSGVELDDLWFPVDKAIPALTRSKIKFATHEDVIAVDSRRAADKERKYLAVLPPLAAPKKTTDGGTAIFSRNEIDPVEIFLAGYQAVYSPDTLDELRACDAVLNYIFKMFLELDPVADINRFVLQVSEAFAQFGITDFCSSLQRSSGAILHNFRLLYGLPEGDGSSNTELYVAILKLWSKATKCRIEDNTTINFNVMLTKCMEAYALQKEQEALTSSVAVQQLNIEQDLEESPQLEEQNSDNSTLHDIQSRIQRASQSLRTDIGQGEDDILL